MKYRETKDQYYALTLSNPIVALPQTIQTALRPVT